MPDSPPKAPAQSNWLHPNQLLQLHRLKVKKKALQARMRCCGGTEGGDSYRSDGSGCSGVVSTKRRNPFVTQREPKKSKVVIESFELEDTSDHTLFKLLHFTDNSLKVNVSDKIISFGNILGKADNDDNTETEHIHIVKAKGEPWIPVDWSLKTRVRFISTTPFKWNQKLKFSEEASGITAFARCLNINDDTSFLDTSPNAKFHQCCLFWQHPYLPWLQLFPRTNRKFTISTKTPTDVLSAKQSLHTAWTESFRSVFQLIRTKQCPYFYVCANSFTVLFRAGGISCFEEIHALITPTTNGFRKSLCQEQIEYTLPLKNRTFFDQVGRSYDSEQTSSEVDDDEPPDDDWLQSMGIDAEDIKQINYTQERIKENTDSKMDNSEESLILIQGMEVHALYNFLMNCKSTVSITGPFAGIPPTILAPVTFYGATLNSLKVRESKVHVDNADYYSLDIVGPVLPSLMHNLCLINPPDSHFTATFSNVTSTLPFSKVKRRNASDVKSKNQCSGSAVFGKENLSDCGLSPFVLKKFCSSDADLICSPECIKYNGETKTFTWT